MPLQSVYDSLILQTRARSSLPSGESGQPPKEARGVWASRLQHKPGSQGLCGCGKGHGGGPEVFWGEACPALSLNSGSRRKHDRRRQGFQPPSSSGAGLGWAGPAVVLPTPRSRGSAGQVPKQNPRHGALYAFIQSHSTEKLLENTWPCLRTHRSSSAGT